MSTTRRTFLKTSVLAGVGLVIDIDRLGFAADNSSADFSPNAYIQIRPDNQIILWVTRSEMGQGVRTTLPMMLADELEADLAQVCLEQASPSPRFKGIRLRTSGSGSTVGTYNVLRKAGATARAMLIAAAAERWQVDATSCHAQSGAVIHSPSNRKATYGSLAQAAARQSVPKNPPLKDPGTFRYIGKPMKRTDGPDIVTGRAKYGIDTRVPAMLHAVMKRSPYVDGKVASFDPRPALAVSGVRHVVPIKSGLATGVAIVADNTWSAMKGAEALKVEWNPGPLRNFDSDAFLREMEQSLDKPSFFVRGDGDAVAAMPSTSRKIDAIYEYPFQAHAPVETMNCIADVRGDSCEIWVPTQTPLTAQEEAAKLLGIPQDAVKVHTTLLGGGFGRRLFVDYVPEAVELSRAIGKPVQLLWTRADDMTCGFFQPCSIVRIAGGLDADANPRVWMQTSVHSELSMIGFPSEADLKDPQHFFKDGLPWGSFDNPYNFPHLKADLVLMNAPVPTGPWRAVMYPAQVFARESFIDEMAHAAGRDPLAFRLELLKPGDIKPIGDQKINRARLIKVLQLAAEKADWGKPLARNKGRAWGQGIACNVYSEDCYIAQVADVSVGDESQDIRVHRVVCAVDCGQVINPAGLDGQAESGITWGLSAALHGRIDFKNGGAVQKNYRDFPVLRINEAPAVDTYIVPSQEPPGGFGETAVPPVIPAVANAVFAATGKRMRRLPITAEKLRA